MALLSLCFSYFISGGDCIGIFSRRVRLRAGPEPSAAAVVELCSGFSAFSGAAYDNIIFRGAVDAIAKHAAKLKPRTAPAMQRLDRILQIEPNPYMSAYDLLYKAATAYFCDNNAFILIHRDDNENVIALYNLSPSSVEFLQHADKMYCKFLFRDGESITLPYADIIHLRRHFAKNELLGTDNAALFPALETAHAQTEGIKTAIVDGVTIRGILKYSTIMNDDLLKKAKDDFVRDYFNIKNGSGLVAIDQKINYEPLKSTPVDIQPEQLDAVQNQIYAYLNISRKIVIGEYSEDEFAAFYESIIEPLALQMSLEFSRKIFTPRERAFGREIIFGGERLDFASAKSRISLLRELLPYGLLTINEGRELLSFNTLTNSAAVVPDATLNEIISKARTMGGLFGEVRLFTIPSNVSVPIGTPTGKAAWHIEGAPVDREKTDVNPVSFSGYELLKIFSLSVAAKRMSVAAFESYITEELTESLVASLGDAIVSGTGAGQPTGLLPGVTWNAQSHSPPLQVVV